MSTEPQTPSTVTTPTESKPTPPETIPYSRFSEVVNQKNAQQIQMDAMAKELNEIKEARENATKKDLEEQGKFKELLEAADAKLETETKVADEYRSYEAARREALSKTLPEKLQKFTDGMSLTDLEEFTELNKTPQSNTPTPPRPGGRATVAEKDWNLMTPSEKQASLEAKIKAHS